MKRHLTTRLKYTFSLVKGEEFFCWEFNGHNDTDRKGEITWCLFGEKSIYPTKIKSIYNLGRHGDESNQVTDSSTIFYFFDSETAYNFIKEYRIDYCQPWCVQVVSSCLP